MDQVSETYYPFAQDDLHTQAKLIDWYYENEHIVQAVTLARAGHQLQSAATG